MQFKHYALFVLFFAFIHTTFADEYGKRRETNIFLSTPNPSYITAALSIPKELTATQKEFAQVVPYAMVEKFFGVATKLTMWQFTFDKVMCGMQFAIGIDPRAAWVIARLTSEKIINWANEAQPCPMPLHAEEFVWQQWASYSLKEHGITSFGTVTPENYLQLFTPEMRQACFKTFARYQFPAYRDFLKTLPGHEEFMFNLPRTGMSEVHQQMHDQYPSDKELGRIWNGLTAEIRAVQERRALQHKLRLEEEARQAAVQNKLQSTHMHQEFTAQHTAIADAMTKVADVPEYAVERHEAIGNYLQGKDTQQTEKRYELSSDAKKLLKHNNVPLQFFTHFKGFEVQHVLHAEYIAMLDEIEKVKDKKLKDALQEGAIAGAEANKLGDLPISCRIADFCHFMIDQAKDDMRATADFAVGASHGAWHSICNAAYAVAHPINTAKGMAQGTIALGKEMCSFITHAYKQKGYCYKVIEQHNAGNYDVVKLLIEQYEREEQPYWQAVDQAMSKRMELFMQMSAQEKGELFGRVALDTYLTGRVFAFTSKVSALTKAKIIDIAQRAKAIRLAKATIAEAGLASEAATAGQVAGKAKVIKESFSLTKEGWNLSETGSVINGRYYSKHALERMAPPTPEVLATLEKRAILRGHKRGTPDFVKYVQAREIPPMVVENAIKNGIQSPGKYQGTLAYDVEGIKVITNLAGDVVTVHKVL